MRLFWHFILAGSGLAVALTNNSSHLHHPQVLSAGGSLPQTGTGDEYDSRFFPVTMLDDEAWYNLLCKGSSLVNAMHASDQDAGKLFQPSSASAESKWKTFGDLATWYWKIDADPAMNKVNFLDDDDDEDFWPGLGLGDMLNDLGLPTHTNDDSTRGIRIINVVHFDRTIRNDVQMYRVGERNYRATAGYYKFGIETTAGAIFGLDRVAPHAAVADLGWDIPEEGLPQLQRFSDVAWLYWQQIAANKQDIEYFFNIAITNTETQKAIRRALKSTNQRYEEWPGASFSTDSDEGKVLLGTPNGRAYGYFLAQHKTELGGNKYISEIRVFMPGTEPPNPNMVLHVVPPRTAAENPPQGNNDLKEKPKL